MEVTLAYGRTGLAVEVPDDAVVIRPTSLPGLPDEGAAIGAEVEPWLSSMAARARRAVVVFPDITRPTSKSARSTAYRCSSTERGLKPTCAS